MIPLPFTDDINKKIQSLKADLKQFGRTPEIDKRLDEMSIFIMSKEYDEWFVAMMAEQGIKITLVKTRNGTRFK